MMTKTHRWPLVLLGITVVAASISLYQALPAPAVALALGSAGVGVVVIAHLCVFAAVIVPIVASHRRKRRRTR